METSSTETMEYKFDISLVRSINKSITSHMPLPTLLESILEVAKTLIGAESSSLLLTDRQSGDLIFNIVIGDKGEIIKGRRVPRGKGIAGMVAETGKPLLVNNAQDDPRLFKEIDDKSGFLTRNIITVPMIVMDELVGVLNVVNSKGKDRYDSVDLEKAQYIAEQAAIAITNRMLYDDLEKRIAELSALYDVANAISLTGHNEDVLQNILSSLSASMNVERASIAIYNREKKKLILEAMCGFEKRGDARIEVDIDSTICGKVFKSGDPLIVSSADGELPLHLRRYRKNYHTDSFISAPIIYKNETIGVLNLADKKNGGIFDSFDLRVLTTVGTQIAEAYQNALNFKNREEQRRLAQEIEIASRIQRGILPRIPAVFHDHRLAAYIQPAREIGGDFYDFFQIDERKYGILIADISGKGIPAALFMGSVRNIINAEKETDPRPSHLLRNCNRHVYNDSESGMFVTLFYATVDMDTRIITYSSAGHNNQLLVRKNRCEEVILNTRGKPLGVLDDQEFQECTVQYEPGDILLLYTDGVLENLGGSDLDADLGERELSRVVSGFADTDPGELINHLKLVMSRNRIATDMKDDITIVAVSL
ncbi:MAG: hypothetical protein CVV44_00605 [Spirochaetae bacterium HGW-Spirochaetae-1]|jgi:serine phosphatase RsbU (regulator of sigma subunit)|nr:MAG: hypothetical protein CVV44_00605 [Spirochaetae bacterium HGW-Spirochaetae-1]